MAWQGNQSRCRNAPLSANTHDPRFHPCRLLDQHIIRKSTTRFGAMKYIPTCTSCMFFIGVDVNFLFLRRKKPSANSSSAALSLWLSRLVLPVMYHFQSSLSDSGSLIRVMQRWIRRFHCLGPPPCLLMMLMDWAISQMCSLTLLSIRCVVKPPLSSQITIVSTAHWLTPILACSAQMRTSRVGIWIVLTSATPDFGDQKASHYILSSQRWSMMKWWILNTCYFEQASEVLNISWWVMWCGSRGEEGVSKVLEIVSEEGRQHEYIYGLGGFFWSGNIILAAIQLGANLLIII